MTRREGRGWRQRLLASLEIFLALGFLTDGIAVGLLASFPSLSDPLSSVPALAGFMLCSSVLLVGVIVLLLRMRGESLASLCFGSVARPRHEVFIGIALVPVIFLAAMLMKSTIRHLLPGIYSGERNVLEEMMQSPSDLALFLGVALFAGGFREEVQRAFVIHRFEADWGPAWLGATLFALLFGYGHLIQGRDEAILAGVFGLAWGLIYAKRRSLVAPALSHGLYDALELVRYYLFGPMRYF